MTAEELNKLYEETGKEEYLVLSSLLKAYNIFKSKL